jgi:hypothetical protein
MRSKVILVVAICTLPLITTARAAHAGIPVQRYASTTGQSTSACTLADPCDIHKAIVSAPTNGDVTVEPGTYGSAGTPIDTVTPTNNNVHIHGQANQPTPVVYVSDLTSLTPGSTLHAIEILNVGGQEGLNLDHAAADHVVIVGGPSGCGGFGTISNSVCWATNANGSGAGAFSLSPGASNLTLINVDAIAPGDQGVGIGVNAGSGATVTVTAVNTIALGGLFSLSAHNLSSDSSGTLTLSHCTYRTKDINNSAPTGGAATINLDKTDLKVDPAFIDLAHGKFAEKPTSKTVDAGKDSAAVGSTDLIGTPRVLGSAVDIGAYELVEKPKISKAKVGHAAHHSITVTARVNPGHLATKAQLIAHHKHTKLTSKKISVGKSGKDKHITLSLTGLSRHQLFTVRLVATSSAGTSTKTFAAQTV